MKPTSYVLITPVRNEESTIGITIESVINQTVLPREWVIVSDQSTDRTDEIIKNYASKFSFIHFLRLECRPNRNFASAVFAIQAGIEALNSMDYEFLGLLDGDIRFAKNYYEEIMRRCHNDSHLGIAGGLVVDIQEGQRRRSIQSLTEIAGAVQFFRRECFESLGGLVALPEGGWDAITCVQARINGFRTRTFPDVEVDHLKPRNIAEGNLPKRFKQLGIRDYALGNHPIFETIKCGYRCLENPVFIGGFMRMIGYLSCYFSQRPRLLSSDIIRFIRREQLRRLFPFLNSPVATSEPLQGR
jgi:poly-beta-1,6-N-acetyl-D-glucosamine synthase